MRYYPLLLDLTNMSCLVVGAGEVGLRKIHGLLECGPARLIAVDPAPPGPELAGLLARHPRFTYQQRPFVPVDMDGMHLVFACTARRDVNRDISEECARRGLFCNRADDPEQGNFVLPANVVQGDLTISVSTNGASPALSRRIRQDLEQRYGPEYARFTRLLRQIRSEVLAMEWPSSANRVIFRDLAASALPELIKNNDVEQCRALLASLLPDSLHARIGDWCHDCLPNF